MFGLGFGELALILVIVIVIFGASRIPELGKGLGEGIRNFKSALKHEEGAKQDGNDELEQKKG
jgi:sec-independent protein translocase protein TatA